MKFYIETYGCTANFGNSREAAEELCRLGHVPADLRSADVLIINSCAVTARTERRLQKRLRQLEGRRLVVAGCLPQAVPQSLQGIRMHGAVGVLNRSGIGDLAALLGSSPGGAFEDGDGDLSAPPCPTRGDDSGDSGDKGDRGGKRDKDDKDDGGDEDDRDEGGRGCEGDDSGDRVGQELAAGQRMDLCGIVNISEG
ncbi:MAG: hypothetical protein GKC10_09745, partial [Methanosarcinales archaeon]|nr:hypothetical protein [Methanosarcinales archaeon]